jgi:hypothetical protein
MSGRTRTPASDVWIEVETTQVIIAVPDEEHTMPGALARAPTGTHPHSAPAADTLPSARAAVPEVRRGRRRDRSDAPFEEDLLGFIEEAYTRGACPTVDDVSPSWVGPLDLSDVGYRFEHEGTGTLRAIGAFPGQALRSSMFVRAILIIAIVAFSIGTTSSEAAQWWTAFLENAVRVADRVLQEAGPWYERVLSARLI